MRLVILVLELVFKLRHIHTAGAFRSTALAGQAQIQRSMHFICANARGGCRNHGTQQIGASACGILLLTRGLKRRAHHTVGFAADALTITLFHSHCQPAFV